MTQTTLDQHLLADELETVRWFADDKDDATRYVGWEKVCERVPELKAGWEVFAETRARLEQEIERARDKFSKVIDKAIERAGCEPQNR